MEHMCHFYGLFCIINAEYLYGQPLEISCLWTGLVTLWHLAKSSLTSLFLYVSDVTRPCDSMVACGMI